MAVFTLVELATYRQVAAVETALGTLLHSLTEGLIVDLVGAGMTGHPRVKPIALEVAARAHRNPDGYSSETVDDYAGRRADGTQAAGVYLTDGERAVLLGLGAAGETRVRSAKLRSPWYEATTT